MQCFFNRLLYIISIGFCFLYIAGTSYGTEIAIKDGWFYVDGEKFLIKAVGYSGWRPYQVPWKEKVDPQLMERDFQMIKEAGFNTLRTWTPLAPEQLDLAKKYNLLVIQGIWFDPTKDYGSPSYVNYAVKRVVEQIQEFQGKDNILMWMIGNEPPVERVLTSGILSTEKLLESIVDNVRQSGTSIPISFANWPMLGFLNNSMLDVISYNVYMYTPVSVSYSLGYQGYIRWLKEKKIKIHKRENMKHT